MHEDVFCAGKEAVFDFLEGVLAEVVAIFPSRFVHVGGDEVLLTPNRTSDHSKQVVRRRLGLAMKVARFEGPVLSITYHNAEQEPRRLVQIAASCLTAGPLVPLRSASCSRGWHGPH